MNFCREIQTTSELLQIFSNTIKRETAFYLAVILERDLKNVNQIKAKMEEESAPIVDQILETKLEEVYEIEAKLQT